MAGLGVAILTDGLANPALAIELRKRDYNAAICHEAKRNNVRISDRGQLAYAADHGWAILTNNARDFVRLDQRWKRQGRSHAGIASYASVPPFGELLHRVISSLDTTTPEMQHDALLWLP